MPGTARRGRRSAVLKNKEAEDESTETEQKGTAEEIETVTESIDQHGTDTLAEDESEQKEIKDESTVPETDDVVELDENGMGAINQDKVEEEVEVDLQIIKHEAPTQEAKDETVEVMIGGLPEPNVIPADSLEPGTQDMPVTGDEKGKIIEEDNVSVKDDTEKADKEKSPGIKLEEEDDASIEMVTTESGPKDDVTDNLTSDKLKEPGTEKTGESSLDTSVKEGTSDAGSLKPVKKTGLADSDLKQTLVSEMSPTLKNTDIPEEDSVPRLQFPDSLAKLRNLTVNIGPIRQMDLKSEKLHEILTLSDNFEIKFELKDKKDVHGGTVQEKSGFVRLPFEITTPTFLIRVAHRLGSLHIDGRDMSVKFPDAFNKALDECKEYMEKVKKLRDEKFERKKRQISVKNVPPNVTEETIRSLFPEAQKVTLNQEELPDGGNKVGSVLLDFDTEEACIQCLDMNKDVFIEDCQLKIFRLYSERRYRTMRVPVYARGRGFGRGRVMPQRGGFQAAKIRKRVLGFGNIARGKGIVGNVTRGGLNRKPIGTLSRKPAAPATSVSKSPGGVGQAKQSPRGPMSTGRGQRRRSSSTSRPGSYQSPGNHEGQFKDFAAPNREMNRGRRRSRPYRGRGNKGFQQRSAERSQSFRGEHPRQSPHRSERSQHRSGGYRNEQTYSQSSSREEDPRAMMEYLKSTIARMEEKMSSRDYDDRHADQSRSSSYSGRGRGSQSRGRGRGRGEQSRKRLSENRDYGQSPKRPYMGDQDRRDSRGDYYGQQQQQQHMNTGGRRDSGVRSSGDMQTNYRHDHISGSHGGGHRGNHGGGHRGSYGGSQRGHESSHGGSQGYRSGSYGDSGDRNRRDSYSGRSENVSSGYSGGQFGMRGRGSSGRGQSRGRGYNKGSSRGQLW